MLLFSYLVFPCLCPSRQKKASFAKRTQFNHPCHFVSQSETSALIPVDYVHPVFVFIDELQVFARAGHGRQEQARVPREKNFAQNQPCLFFQYLVNCNQGESRVIKRNQGQSRAVKGSQGMRRKDLSLPKRQFRKENLGFYSKNNRQKLAKKPSSFFVLPF